MLKQSLFNETGTFTFSQCGQYPALVCKGDEAFLKRCHSLISNFSIVKTGKWHLFGSLDAKEQTRYVLAPKEDILSGLKEYFKWEVIQNYGEEIKYSYKIDDNENIIVDWDESKVEELAQKLTEKFWQEKVIKDNVLINHNKASSYETFSVSRNHKNKNINY